MSDTRVAESYEKCVNLVEHYKAIGTTKICLLNLFGHGKSMSDEDFDRGLPWELATSVKAGGSIRHGVEVDLSFEAEHPCGLTFTWSFYIENRDRPFAQTGDPTIDFENILKIAKRLPPQVLLEVQKILRNNAAVMRKQQQDAWEYYSKVSHSAAFAENFVEALKEVRNG